MKADKKKTLIIKVSDAGSADTDRIDLKHSDNKTTVLNVDIGTVDAVARATGRLEDKYKISADEILAHAATDAVVYTYNGGDYGLAHSEGLGYENDVMRKPINRMPIKATVTVDGVLKILYNNGMEGRVQ